MPEGTSPPAVLRRDAIYRRSLAVADLVSATFALVLAVNVLGDDRLTLPVVLVVPSIVLVGKILGLYDRDEHLLNKTTLDEAPKLLQVATLYAFLIALTESLFIDGQLGHAQAAGLWGLLFVSMVLARMLARLAARRLTTPERCLVVGGPRECSWVEAKLREHSTARARVVGRVPLDDGLGGNSAPRSRAPLAPVVGGVDQLGTVVVTHEVDRAIVAPGASSSDSLLEVVRLVKSMGVKVTVIPSLFEVVGFSVEFDDLHGTTLLGLRREGLSRSSRAVKRGTDIVGAITALLVTAPIWMAAALAIRLSSPGPVLFRQLRVGRDGRRFTMLKFRTMVDGADDDKAELLSLNEAEGLFKIADDPRITWVGRLLRRSSLDELPQLVNVLRGDMSMVGPRPLVPDDDSRVEGWERRRLSIYPGMTGLWQIFGSSRIPLSEMVKIDYIYGANWSLWLDVKILLRTVLHVLRRRGV